MLGKAYLYNYQTEEAKKYFEKTANIEYLAYCYFLLGNIEEAFIHLQLIKYQSPLSNWLDAIICLVKRIPTTNFPTYFQIRNFYEQDLDMLFKNNQIELVNELLQRNYYLENVNKEVYKFSARVLFNNNYNEIALNFIEKSIDICYKDPETHFIKAQILLKEGKKEEAIVAFKKADKVSGNYMPAKAQLKDLSEQIE